MTRSISPAGEAYWSEPKRSPMTDNGAKALAERLYTLVSVEDHGQLCPVWSRRKHPAEKAECDCWVQPQSAERADAILANGAVFLTAEEAERLRRIEEVATEALLSEALPGNIYHRLRKALWPQHVTDDTFCLCDGCYEYMLEDSRAAALTEPSHD